MRFSISFSRLGRVVLGLLGMGPGRTLVRLDDQFLRIRMGWAFRVRIPREAIETAQAAGPAPWSSGVGVHGWRGSWVVNGRRGPTVVVELTEAVPARVGPFRSGVRRLQIGLEQPEALVEALSGRVADRPTG